MSTKVNEPLPIRLSDLRRRVTSGTLTKHELVAYFTIDDRKSRPFAPALKLTGLVDKEGRRPTAKTVTRLYYEAEGSIPPPDESLAATRKRMTPGPARRTGKIQMGVLVEGDSWFNLPDYLYAGRLDDIVDVLKRSFELNRLAYWGDELEKMVTANSTNYRHQLLSGLYRHFLFSGGGNDVLGSIKKYLLPRQTQGARPSNPASYIDGSFNTKLDAIFSHYATLVGHVHEVTDRSITLYLHGYGYARPRRGGEFLGRHFEQLGFEAESPLARDIVKELVDRTNRRLRSFASTLSKRYPRYRVVHIDLREILSDDDDWLHDEIHPSSRGAAKAAAVFARELKSGIPVA